MNPADIRILLIEDEPHIRRFVRSTLEGQQWTVYEADNGQRGLVEAASRQPQLLIVDLGLPDMDGVALIRDFRHWSQAPVLVLSARSDEADKIAALDAGADDYLTKPFGVGELLARVRALTRRHARQLDASPLLHFGEVSVDLARREVRRGGVEVALTPMEYTLLCALLRDAGKALTHRMLMQAVWGPGHADDSHYLRIYMSRLRQKLEQDPAQPVHFITLSGVGYRFQF
ncbi:response regulator [Vogesella facilis]|uniref:Response regulator n=1 Tax=Vogesella facilis TaxID=1655232 RepID=A0ABV7REM9_9NEIS